MKNQEAGGIPSAFSNTLSPPVTISSLRNTGLNHFLCLYKLTACISLKQPKILALSAILLFKSWHETTFRGRPFQKFSSYEKHHLKGWVIPITWASSTSGSSLFSLQLEKASLTVRRRSEPGNLSWNYEISLVTKKSQSTAVRIFWGTWYSGWHFCPWQHGWDWIIF